MSWRRQMKALKETLTKLEADNETLRTENLALKNVVETLRAEYGKQKEKLEKAAKCIIKLESAEPKKELPKKIQKVG